jgi:hypothetical protein
MDSVELLHAAAKGDRSRWLVVAIPATQTGDDPRRPCQAERRMFSGAVNTLAAAIRLCFGVQF